jgi:hypothetical protein
VCLCLYTLLVLRACDAGLREEELKAVFEVWDADGGGTLDMKEFERAVRGGARRAPTDGHSSSIKDMQQVLSQRMKPSPVKDPKVAIAKQRSSNKRGKDKAEEVDPGEYEETGAEPEGTRLAQPRMSALPRFE